MKEKSELGAVISFFELEQGARVSPLQGGTANQLFKLELAHRKLVLRKRSRKYSDENWVGFEEDYLHHVAGRGIPVPVPCRNAKGQSWLRQDGHIYQVYPFMEGEPFQNGDLDEVAAAGAFLGRVHNAARGLNSSYVKPLPRYDDPRLALNKLQRDEGSFRRLLNDEERVILQKLERRLNGIAAAVPDNMYDSLPRLVIHGDFHPGNVKYSGRQICALFDFDRISAQPRIRDVADGLIYFATVREQAWDGGDIFSLVSAGTFHAERMSAFLTAYHAAGSEPLKRIELELLPHFILARLINSRVEALDKIPRERSGEMLTDRIMAAVDWWDRHGGGFVQSIADRLGIERQGGPDGDRDEITSTS